MDINDFEVAEIIVKEIRELEKEYKDVQKIMGDRERGLVIATGDGSEEILNASVIDKVCFSIDDSYNEEIDKLYHKLKNI